MKKWINNQNLIPKTFVRNIKKPFIQGLIYSIQL